MLNENFEGNLTLKGVTRGQSGTYGCRVEDYDAADDVQLSKTLELRVACESPGGRGRQEGPWHQCLCTLLPTALKLLCHPKQSAFNPFSAFLVFWGFVLFCFFRWNLAFAA